MEEKEEREKREEREEREECGRRSVRATSPHLYDWSDQRLTTVLVMGVSLPLPLLASLLLILLQLATVVLATVLLPLLLLD